MAQKFNTLYRIIQDSRIKLCILLLAAGLGGCKWPSPTKTPSSPKATPISPSNTAQTLAMLQKAYPNLADCDIAPLLDFNSGSQPTGRQQAEWFSLLGSIAPAVDEKAPQTKPITVTNSAARTGSGGLFVQLPRGGALRFTPPGPLDFTKHTVLQCAIRVERKRDDLRVTLHSSAGRWVSPPIIVTPGWNVVQVGLQQPGRLAQQGRFAIDQISAVDWQFPKAAGSISLAMDDLLLVNNFRNLTPTPPAITLQRKGLDYALKLPGGQGTLIWEQTPSSLWAMGVHQPKITLASPDTPWPSGEASLAIMGTNRVGQLRILEKNRLRVRLENTWFFPLRSGEWASVGVRMIRWRYTFYGDGRWITTMHLDNAGGQTLGKVRITLPGRPAAWAGAKIARQWENADFIGPVANWQYLLAPVGQDGSIQQKNYLTPAAVEPMITAPLSTENDNTARPRHWRFDAAQGCYVLAGLKGHCRFRLHPNSEGLIRPAIRVLGPWAKAPYVNMEGQVIRHVELLADGSALFILPGRHESPVFVELRGELCKQKSAN